MDYYYDLPERHLNYIVKALMDTGSYSFVRPKDQYLVARDREEGGPPPEDNPTVEYCLDYYGLKRMATLCLVKKEPVRTWCLTLRSAAVLSSQTLPNLLSEQLDPLSEIIDCESLSAHRAQITVMTSVRPAICTYAVGSITIDVITVYEVINT